MTRQARFLAIDLGAESGRGVIGTIDGSRLSLDEVHRFPNEPLRLFDGLHWNVYALFQHIVESIRRGVSSSPLHGIGIDSWGVDFGLLGPDDTLLGLPYHYRDQLTAGVMERTIETIGTDMIFSETGIQFLPFNTLYQLIALKNKRPELLESARTLLMVGELFTFWLTGKKISESTNASTTQLLHPQTHMWSSQLIDALKLPITILPDTVLPGTVVGPLIPSISKVTGARAVPVIAPAIHDTASAVAAVPAQGDNWCYLSSGTWSLLGVETTAPVMTPSAQKYNFTNERGVANTFRLLKNVMGMWLLQECRRQWTTVGHSYSYDQLSQMAETAPPFKTFINPNDPDFFAPGDMPGKIIDYARKTGQPIPSSPGEFARTIAESLALKYNIVIGQLEQLSEKKINTIHIVGGGSQNTLLNQLTADATGRPVVAGPVEATATGNILVQAMAMGLVRSLAELRDISRQSNTLRVYEPRKSDRWDTARDRFRQLT